MEYLSPVAATLASKTYLEKVENKTFLQSTISKTKRVAFECFTLMAYVVFMPIFVTLNVVLLRGETSYKIGLLSMTTKSKVIIKTTLFICSFFGNSSKLASEHLNFYIRNGDAEITKFLIYSGAKPDEKTSETLYDAIQKGHNEVALLLLSRGIKPKKREDTTKEVLTVAIENYCDSKKKDLSLVKILLKDPSLFPSEESWKCYLTNPFSFLDKYHFHYSNLNKTERLELLETLLTNGINPNPNGTSFPLWYAVDLNDLEAIKLLLAHGARIDRGQYSPSLNTVLDHSIQCALRTGNCTILKEIIKDKQHLNSFPRLSDNTTLDFLKTSYPEYSLINHKRRNQILKLLLEAGVNPNPQDTSAPLCSAIKTDNLEAFNLLLKHGARPTLHERIIYSIAVDHPAGYAIKRALNHSDYKYLKELAKDKENFEFGIASRCLNSTFTFLHPENRFRPNYSKKNVAKVLEEILKSDIDPNINNTSELLAMALKSRNLEAVKVLLKFGARTDLPTGIHMGTRTDLPFRERSSAPSFTLGDFYYKYCEHLPGFKETIGNKFQRRAPPRQERSQSSRSNHGGSSGRRTILNPDEQYRKNCKEEIIDKFGNSSSNKTLEQYRLKIVEKQCDAKTLLNLKSNNKKSIESAYKKLAKKLHPDKHNNSPEDRALAEALFKCLGAAKTSLLEGLKS